jgi:uncharacterized Zn-binding protein involved in type VI secretion
MGQPASKQGDTITAHDMHLVQPSSTNPPVSTPLPFAGIINGGLSSSVNIMGRPAATVNSTAANTPPHVPPGGTFVKPPSNQAMIITGSATVMINGNAAARNGDTAITCNDPADLPAGTVVASGTVMIG